MLVLFNNWDHGSLSVTEGRSMKVNREFVDQRLGELRQQKYQLEARLEELMHLRYESQVCHPHYYANAVVFCRRLQ